MRECLQVRLGWQIFCIFDRISPNFSSQHRRVSQLLLRKCKTKFVLGQQSQKLAYRSFCKSQGVTITKYPYFVNIKLSSSSKMDKEDSKKTTRSKNQKRKSELDSSESTKKSRLENLPGSKPLDDVDFVQQIAQCRTAACESIEAFKFNKKRVRVLSEAKDCPDEGKGVLYWMSRDQRVQDNWAFLYAQRLALKLKLPLYVCFCLVPNFLEATIRQFGFMLKGLAEVEKECRNLDISFYLLMGKAKDVLPEFIKNHHIGGVVTDFSPLRIPSAWVTELSALLPKDVPFCQVDAHNIVPCWVASPKLEYSARTIRSKIHKVLNEYLTEFPPLIKHPHKSPTMPKSVNWEKAAEFLEVDRTVKEVDWAQPGTTGAYHTLATFCNKRLKFYESDRNDPNKEALSDLSPWFHFGQISPQRCVLAVRGFRSRAKESVDAFIEESVIRRELTDNFCFYNENYDSIKGAAKWAQDTLEAHRNDKRAYVYNRQQLEQAKTHDNLWNAAQIQLLKEGKMHGFLRMYWAKKILEWTPSPEEALKETIYLNDRYSIDGRDPNGYVGCMWSICGIHDQGWKERPIFGKIRYMNYEGCKRKFDVASFVKKYSKL